MIQFYGTEQDPQSEVVDGTSDELFSKLRIAFEQGLAPTTLVAPIFVLWELTGKCPQNCCYCYNRSPKQITNLSGKRLFGVADELIDAKIFNVCLSGGEPLTRPEYIDLLHYIAASGISVGTVLSGAGITNAIAGKIAQYASTVQISLDGASPEVHDLVRGRKGSFNDALKAIKLFRALGKSVHIAFAATRHNIHDFPNVYDLCCTHTVTALRTQKLVISGKALDNKDQIAASKEQYQEFELFCRKHASNKPPILYSDPTTHINFGRQYNMSIIARISAEGYVSPSPYINTFFGSLQDESFPQIWNRMKHAWGHPKLKEFLAHHVICEDGIIGIDDDSSLFIK